MTKPITFHSWIENQIIHARTIAIFILLLIIYMPFAVIGYIIDKLKK